MDIEKNCNNKRKIKKRVKAENICKKLKEIF